VFVCQLCRRAVPPHTPAHRLVVETRPRKYPFRREANLVVRLNDNGKKKEYRIDDPGGAGRETVRELVVCPSCAAAGNGG
jgi:hypothetical protein